jgi:hypothetical protein
MSILPCFPRRFDPLQKRTRRTSRSRLRRGSQRSILLPRPGPFGPNAGKTSGWTWSKFKDQSVARREQPAVPIASRFLRTALRRVLEALRTGETSRNIRLRTTGQTAGHQAPASVFVTTITNVTGGASNVNNFITRTSSHVHILDASCGLARITRASFSLDRPCRAPTLFFVNEM